MYIKINVAVTQYIIMPKFNPKYNSTMIPMYFDGKGFSEVTSHITKTDATVF